MSFIEANSLYRQGKYQLALKRYLELSERYGVDLVSANIELCYQKLGKDQSIENDMQKLNPSRIDIVSKILLDNDNKKLTDEERNQYLKEFNNLKNFKSEDVEISNVKSIPSEWPEEMNLFKLPESTNDFVWHLDYIKINNKYNKLKNVGLSVVIPTFNRSKILSITLTSLVNQKTKYPFEVIVADDGSSEKIDEITRQFEDVLDIKYVRQKDYGYQLCAVRNLGIRTSKYDLVAILDCDMAANPYWVQSYVDTLIENQNVALIGPRKYIDTKDLTQKEIIDDPEIFEKLPTVKSDSISTSSEDGYSKDWRLDHFTKTENLRTCDSPFRYFSGGNVAFHKKWIEKAGSFDEEFTHWGGEDNEFGYRLYRMGCFFRSLDGAMAYHQEPPGKENETDRSEGQAITRKIIEQKVPYFYRKLEPIEITTIKRVPLVSIYIPAYNCEYTILRCVESALNQTVTDLEVCICNDGSTDNTLNIITQHYSKHPRVRFVSQNNGGIAKASNTAVKMCKGFYIGQLDSDDYLEPDAVQLCLNEFFRDRNLACVYTANRNVNPDGSLIANGYNWPAFSREKLTTAMILHHFRMFTIRAWNLTTGFDEEIENSVDYDMFLKLSEVGAFKHINKICYNRVLHGENTSIKNLGKQKSNHFIAVNNSLKRQGINHFSIKPIDDDDASRTFSIVRNRCVEKLQDVTSGLAFSLIASGKLTGINAKIKNIMLYNPCTKIIVINCDPEKVTSIDKEMVDSLAGFFGVQIVINDRVSHVNFKYKQVEYHLSNYKIIKDKKVDYSYLIFDIYDCMYVQKGMLKFVSDYDVGLASGKLTGYWKEKICGHSSLQSFVKESLNSNIELLDVKGMLNGMFIKSSIAPEIMKIMHEILALCKQNDDMPKYPAEEVWFGIAILVHRQKNTSIRRANTTTYLPWDRKLQWNEQQIEDAKKGIGISANKFAINRYRW